MEELFKKYCLIGILCTIVCKALFLYLPGDSVTSHEANTKNVIAIPSAVDNYEDLANGRFVQKKFLNPGNDLTIWEGEETEEDEESDDSFLTKNSVITVLKIKDWDALNSLLCFATIPLFILFYAWKSFLF